MLEADAGTTSNNQEMVIGKILVSGGKAVSSLAAGNIKQVDADLKIVADAIYDYLGIQSTPQV